MIEPSLEEFSQTCNLSSIVNRPTWYINPNIPSCINTNNLENFSRQQLLRLGIVNRKKSVKKLWRNSIVSWKYAENEWHHSVQNFWNIQDGMSCGWFAQRRKTWSLKSVVPGNTINFLLKLPCMSPATLSLLHFLPVLGENIHLKV